VIVVIPVNLFSEFIDEKTKNSITIFSRLVGHPVVICMYIPTGKHSCFVSCTQRRGAVEENFRDKGKATLGKLLILLSRALGPVPVSSFTQFLFFQ
jgi:hypothetical protein